MTHIIKLCVGVSTPEELADWRARRRASGYGREDGCDVHTTRMMPKRADEVVGKGSLYWVMSNTIRCRQLIVGLEADTDGEGKSCCHIIMDPELVLTVPQPKRPFQGWRYLRPQDAPADLTTGTGSGDVELAEELAKLGLL